jgi:KDO2-lipid IV(A) lauroyltransferase
MSLKLWTMRVCQPLVGRFPGFFYHVADLVGAILFATRPGLRRKVIRNMEPFAEGDRGRAGRLGRRLVQNVAAYYVDLCSLPYRNMARFEAEHLELVNGERLAALEEPGPVVAVSAHTGNAEFAIQALTARGRPFLALVEAQEPQVWADYLLRLRSSVGGSFHEANFAGIRACIEALHAGGLVGFMADRDLQGNGLCAPVAGRCAQLPRGPWEIARRTGALVLPVFTSRDKGDRFRVFVGEPFRVARTDDAEGDVRQAILGYARLLEEHLRRGPAQWAVTEDFWRVHGCG